MRELILIYKNNVQPVLDKKRLHPLHGHDQVLFEQLVARQVIEKIVQTYFLEYIGVLFQAWYLQKRLILVVVALKVGREKVIKILGRERSGGR